jgi:hypothetical protein
MAFSSAGTRNPDAFAIFNTSTARRNMVVRVTGTKAAAFDAYETGPGQNWRELGAHEVRDGELWISLSAGAVVSFVAK